MHRHAGVPIEVNGSVESSLRCVEFETQLLSPTGIKAPRKTFGENTWVERPNGSLL